MGRNAAAPDSWFQVTTVAHAAQCITCNIDSQFHISGGPEAQRTPLPIKLVLPDHASLLERLELVKGSLENTEFRFEQKGDLVAVTDPFGQHFEVHQPSKDNVYERGIKDILLPCAPGTAAAIGAFYEKFYKVIFLDLKKPENIKGFFATVATRPAGQAITSGLSLNKQYVQDHDTVCFLSESIAVAGPADPRGRCMLASLSTIVRYLCFLQFRHHISPFRPMAMVDQAWAMLNRCDLQKIFAVNPCFL